MNRKFRDYLELGVDEDFNPTTRFREATRLNRGRIAAVASEVGRTIMDGLSGAMEHPYVATTVESAALIGGFTLGALIFSGEN